MAAIAFFNAFVQLTVMNTILTHFKNIFNKFDTNFQGGGVKRIRGILADFWFAPLPFGRRYTGEKKLTWEVENAYIKSFLSYSLT